MKEDKSWLLMDGGVRRWTGVAWWCEDRSEPRGGQRERETTENRERWTKEEKNKKGVWRFGM